MTGHDRPHRDWRTLDPIAACAASLAVGLASATAVLAADPATASPRGMTFSAPAVGYNPPKFSQSSGGSATSPDDVVVELRALREAGFTGLVTYAATGVLGSVPRLARKNGFKGTIIMGIWDPSSPQERDNAISQAQYVDGYCVGNEGLGSRYSLQELAQRMAELRTATGRPVTTSEPIDRYLYGPFRVWLRAHSDWLFPIAHPFWADQVDPKAAVDWIVARHDLLVAATGKAVIVKEAGVPTAGVPGYGERSQIHFFELFENTRIPFFYFEAFDQPWKSAERGHQSEAHWGLFRNDGTPKEIVPWLKTRFVVR